MPRLPLSVALVLVVFCGQVHADPGVAGAAVATADPTVAVVNGVPVYASEFADAAARKTPANGQNLSEAEKAEVLDSLVEEKLLYVVALRLGLDHDPKVQKVMVNTLLRDQVYAHVRNSDFTDADLKEYYDAHKEQFVVPEKVQIKRILIKIADTRDDAAAKKEAERIRKEVAKSPDSTFKDAASKYSEDPYRRRGGDVGFVAAEGKPGLPQIVVDKAFSLKQGQVSEVFRTDDGYNVILVAARRERIERTFEQMKGSVLRKVKNDRMKGLYDAYVHEHRAGADIRVDTAALDAVPIQSSWRPLMPGAPEVELDQIPPDAPGMYEPEE